MPAVPTQHPRHSITETGPVADVLGRLREVSPSQKVDLVELVVLGGEEKLKRLAVAESDAEGRRALRARFAERTRTQRGLDPDAASRARDQGWSHD